MQEQEFLAAGNPFQGDIASYMFDQEQDTLREEGLDVSDVYPIYSDMHAEAMRRNLSV